MNHVMDQHDHALAALVRESIEYAATNSARSDQSKDFRMGISNLGHCQQYAVLMTRQTPYSDEVQHRAAFFGTAAGDAVERAVKQRFPAVLVQKEAATVFRVPSGGEVPGTPDIVVTPDVATDLIPQGVYDLKSKAEMETIKKVGQTQQQRFQVHALAAGLIDDGVLDPTQPIRVADIYFDRSGTQEEVWVIGHWYDDNVRFEIDEWIDGVKYAVINNEDGHREPSRAFCETYCEFFTVCRGEDTDVTGLITDPEKVAAVAQYKELSQLKGAIDKSMDQLKPLLEGLEGSTGEWKIRPLVVEGGHVEYDRPTYTRPSITKVAAPKAKTGRKPKASGD